MSAHLHQDHDQKKSHHHDPKSDHKSAKKDDQTGTSGDQNLELDKLKADLEEAKNHITGLTETAKRAMADLQNFRRRSEEEKKAFIEFANAGLMLEILPTLDNLQRALKNVPENLKSHDFVQGILHTEKGLLTALEKFGLNAIESIGKPFEPALHEALLEAPGEKGIILEELEKGYLLGEKILRPSKVKVGNG